MVLTIWSYWELGKLPHSYKLSFYDLIWRTVLNNIDNSVKLILVTPSNINDYLTNLPSNLDLLPTIAQKVDFIRTKLLYLYGGMWIDIDTILVRNIDYFVRLFNMYDFVAVNYSIDHYDQSYMIVHDPIMISKPKGRVITEMYNLFENYLINLKNCNTMNYDKSSEILTKSLEKCDKSDYLLLSHNLFDKFHQHCPHLWIKDLSKLSKSENVILNDWIDQSFMIICGSAHLFSYIDYFFNSSKIFKKEDSDYDKKQIFLNKIMNSITGKLLITAGISNKIDSYIVKYNGFIGHICPYRKFIIWDTYYNHQSILDCLFSLNMSKSFTEISYNPIEHQKYLKFMIITNPQERFDWLLHMWKNYSNNSANISNSDIFCYLINGGPNVNLFLNMNKYLSNIMVAQYQLYHLLPVDYYLKSDQLDYELNMLHELTKSIVVKKYQNKLFDDQIQLPEIYIDDQIWYNHTKSLRSYNIVEKVDLDFDDKLLTVDSNANLLKSLPFMNIEYDYQKINNYLKIWSITNDQSVMLYYTWCKGYFLSHLNNNNLVLLINLSNFVCKSDINKFYNNNSDQLVVENDVWIKKIYDFEEIYEITTNLKKIAFKSELIFDSYKSYGVVYNGSYKRSIIIYQFCYTIDNKMLEFNIQS